MVGAHCVQDKRTIAIQWLSGSDCLRVRVTVALFPSCTQGPSTVPDPPTVTRSWRLAGEAQDSASKIRAHLSLPWNGTNDREKHLVQFRSVATGGIGAKTRPDRFRFGFLGENVTQTLGQRPLPAPKTSGRPFKMPVYLF